MQYKAREKTVSGWQNSAMQYVIYTRISKLKYQVCPSPETRFIFSLPDAHYTTAEFFFNSGMLFFFNHQTFYTVNSHQLA